MVTFAYPPPTPTIFFHLSTHPTSCSLSSPPLFPSLILYPSPSPPTLCLPFHWVQLVLAMYSWVWHLHYIKKRREEKREGDAGKILDMVLWLKDKGSTYMCEFSTFFWRTSVSILLEFEYFLWAIVVWEKWHFLPRYK